MMRSAGSAAVDAAARPVAAARVAPLVLLLLALAGHAGPAPAQGLPGDLSDTGAGELSRPSDRPLPSLEGDGPRETPPLALPPVSPAPPADGRGVPGLRVHVRGYRFTGNTVFSDEQLSAVAAPYQDRAITTEDLEELRRALTLRYVESGYINSGAVLPDQTVTDGIVEFLIVEGRLTDIEVSGLTRLRPEFVRERLALGAGPPLDVNALQARFQIVLQEPTIERLNADLKPGTRPGEASLLVRVQEAPPWYVSATLDNEVSPSVGELRARVQGGVYSLAGRGDLLNVEAAVASGLTEISGGYSMPLDARDTRLGLYAEAVRSKVVEEPFDRIDIESEAWSLGVRLSRPLYRTPTDTLATGLALERRHSNTSLLGRGFAFSPGVAPDGDSDVTVARWTVDWLSRGRERVVAARSTLSLGVDALGATVNAGAPDGRFLAWLGQFQWAQRLGEGGTQLILRSDLQLADGALLPLEKYSVGGVSSVRGYRENQLVRDWGYSASLELRVPLLQEAGGRDLLQLAPFVDIGGAWNRDASTPKPRDLASAGLGLRWSPHPRVHGQVYWGYALRDVGNPDNNLQDYGVHFLLRAELPN